MAAAGSSLVITLVTLLGGIGVLPDGGSPAAASSDPSARDAATLTSVITTPAPASSAPATTDRSVPRSSTGSSPRSNTGSTTGSSLAPLAVPLPADSGAGRRVVFDMSDQRVWLVEPGPGGADEVDRTYLVSGSLTDNLGPGTYRVYSRSRWAVGIADSGSMEYFVRFTRGANAAIGFHSIPTKNDHPLQTTAELGTPQSHGCIRQALPDARTLWHFAPIGTKVVVTA